MLALTSCSAQKTSIFWVNSYKSPCMGVGKMMCLIVSKNKDLSKAKWQPIYEGIEGFNFEEGYLQKIQVKVTQLKAKDVPADASTIKYTLVKVLEKRKDYKTSIAGSWILKNINDKAIENIKNIPTLNIDLEGKRIFGNSGCNNYNGGIFDFSANAIHFTPIVSTRMACINDNVEHQYFQQLDSVFSYQLKGNILTFYNTEGKKVLSFIQKTTPVAVAKQTANNRLHNIWAAVKVDGAIVNKMIKTPTLELNLTQNKMMGFNGCNTFSGNINKANETELSFTDIATTEMLCAKMDIPNKFSQKLLEVTSYKFVDNKLILLDKNNNEVLVFIQQKK